ncbi:hypothetical protein Tco_1039222, partial [Tanacetum coccineum]
VCENVNDEEDQYKLDEEALNLVLEEARAAQAEQEWLEKCRKEQELDEEHERQLWGFYLIDGIGPKKAILARYRLGLVSHLNDNSKPLGRFPPYKGKQIFLQVGKEREGNSFRPGGEKS